MFIQTLRMKHNIAEGASIVERLLLLTKVATTRTIITSMALDFWVLADWTRQKYPLRAVCVLPELLIPSVNEFLRGLFWTLNRNPLLLCLHRGPPFAILKAATFIFTETCPLVAAFHLFTSALHHLIKITEAI